MKVEVDITSRSVAPYSYSISADVLVKGVEICMKGFVHEVVDVVGEMVRKEL